MKRVILDLCIVDTDGNVDIGLSYPFGVHAVMLSLVVPTAEVAVCNIGIKAFPAAFPGLAAGRHDHPPGSGSGRRRGQQRLQLSCATPSLARLRYAKNHVFR